MKCHTIIVSFQMNSIKVKSSTSYIELPCFKYLKKLKHVLKYNINQIKMLKLTKQGERDLCLEVK